MIIVRDVFSLKFGKAREMKALMQESKKLMDKEMLERSRVMFDLVGPAYTMVLESSFKNLAEFESSLSQTFSKPEWGAWYQKIVPLVDKSYREIFTLVD